MGFGDFAGVNSNNFALLCLMPACRPQCFQRSGTERRSMELVNFLKLERNDWNFLKYEELFVLERLNAGNFDHKKLATAFKFS